MPCDQIWVLLEGKDPEEMGRRHNVLVVSKGWGATENSQQGCGLIHS